MKDGPMEINYKEMDYKDFYNVLLLNRRIVPFRSEEHVVREEIEEPGDPVYDRVGRRVGRLIRKPKPIFQNKRG